MIRFNYPDGMYTIVTQDEDVLFRQFRIAHDAMSELLQYHPTISIEIAAETFKDDKKINNVARLVFNVDYDPRGHTEILYAQVKFLVNARTVTYSSVLVERKEP